MNNSQIDLRDVPCMPLDVRRLLTSDTWLAAADDTAVGYALMTLWMQSWHQVPAGSLPASDAVLARLAMCDMTTWTRIKSAALAGWTIAEDGRYHHGVIGEKAVECDEARAKKLAFAQIQRAKGIASAAARALGKPAEAKPAKAAPVTMERDVDPRQLDVFIDSPAGSVSEVKAEKKDRVAEIFDYYKEVMQSQRSKLDAKRRKLIDMRLKEGYTVEELMLAIDGCRANPFNMGDNDRHTLFNSIELILRDAKHIDDFIKEATGAKNAFAVPGTGLSTKAKKSFDAISRSLNKGNGNDDNVGEIV